MRMSGVEFRLEVGESTVNHLLVEASGVRLFSYYDSDQSTCIYVDSSLNSSIRSELNSSELNSSELKNSSTSTSTSTFSDFSSNESFFLNELFTEMLLYKCRLLTE